MIMRVCRSTLVADTDSMSTGTEQGMHIRSAVCVMKTQLDMQDWETSSANNMARVWITDRESVCGHLISTKSKQVGNQRLPIGMAALRHIIWGRRDDMGTTMDETKKGSYPRWIDTSATVAYHLTDVMHADRLYNTMMTGTFDMTPTAESLIVKEKNRASRKETNEEQEKADAEECPD